MVGHVTPNHVILVLLDLSKSLTDGEAIGNKSQSRHCGRIQASFWRFLWAALRGHLMVGYVTLNHVI